MADTRGGVAVATGTGVSVGNCEGTTVAVTMGVGGSGGVAGAAGDAGAGG